MRNHPQKGSTTLVEPIKSCEDINRIKNNLSSNMRNLLLFTIGINNGLRIGDILALKVGDVRYLGIGESLDIIEKKNAIKNILVINDEVFTILHQYINSKKYSDDDYLFKSRKGDNLPLSVSSVNRMVKGWTQGMKGNFGTHSLRKTFGYIQRTKYRVPLSVLRERFNHKSLDVTITYTGLEDVNINDVKNMLMNRI